MRTDAPAHKRRAAGRPAGPAGLLAAALEAARGDGLVTDWLLKLAAAGGAGQDPEECPGADAGSAASGAAVVPGGRGAPPARSVRQRRRRKGAKG